jgi:hypothetical protein
VSDPQAPSGWDIAALIGGAATLLGLFGKGVAHLLHWGERREKARADRLEREEGELAEGWSSYRKRIEARLAQVEASDALRARENAALRVAFEIVAGAMRVLDPGNSALVLAEQILASAFPVIPQVPPEIAQQLGAVEAADDALRAN